jgi:hypothetical protein
MQRTQYVLVTALTAVFFSYAAADENAFSYPETPAGTIARAFFETLNSGDPDRISDFILSYRSTTSLAKRPLDERVAKMMQIHKQVGELTPTLVTEESERSLAVTVRSEQLGMWLSVRFDLDESEPDKLAVMSMQPTSPPDVGVSEELTWNSLPDRRSGTLRRAGGGYGGCSGQERRFPHRLDHKVNDRDDDRAPRRTGPPGLGGHDR